MIRLCSSWEGGLFVEYSTIALWALAMMLIVSGSTYLVMRAAPLPGFSTTLYALLAFITNAIVLASALIGYIRFIGGLC